MTKCINCNNVAVYKLYDSDEVFCKECALKYLQVKNEENSQNLYGFAELFHPIKELASDNVSILDKNTNTIKVIKKEDYIKTLKHIY